VPSQDVTAPHYGSSTVYGPFFRRANDRTQTTEDVRRIVRSGELWGRPARGSDIASAKAYVGPIPRGVSGFEFYATDEPNRPYGPIAYWMPTAHDRVRSEDGWAKLKILVSLVSQDL
jgi:hypothetical protein